MAWRRCREKLLMDPALGVFKAGFAGGGSRKGRPGQPRPFSGSASGSCRVGRVVIVVKDPTASQSGALQGQIDRATARAGPSCAIGAQAGGLLGIHQRCGATRT